MGRLPLTVWAFFVTSILGLFAFPPLAAAAIMLLLDRHLGTSFFTPYIVVADKSIPHEGGLPHNLARMTYNEFAFKVTVNFAHRLNGFVIAIVNLRAFLDGQGFPIRSIERFRKVARRSGCPSSFPRKVECLD